MKNISKSFPGVRALDEVSLTVRGGTVHALMGENGAGKSTLMKCLFGVYKKDSGRILIDGKEVEFKNAREALVGGVAMVHQELNLALDLPVMDNMFLGRFPRVIKHLPFTSEKKLYERTREIFSRLGLDIDPRVKAKSLSVSKRQMIEIAKAISYGARVIVFDEPTSSLTEKESEALFSIIDMLKADGCAIIYISHKMDEILRICDCITVMRDGRYITTRAASEITTDELIKLMVGRTLEERYPEKTNKPSETLLKIEGLSSRASGLKNISFELMRGEILGIAGLDGAGRTELLESIFGLKSIDGGRIELNGREIKNDTPRAAIKNGFALVTEERRAGGIFAILSIRENTVISSLKCFSRFGILSEKQMKARTLENIKKLRIKTPGEKAKIRSLSGGNQQKVILGRWLLTSPTVFMLDEPTRGIDVGAKYEIYKLMLELANEGKGVIMVSSEMGELIGMCDRILVMSGRNAAGILSKDEATQERIMALAAKFA